MSEDIERIDISDLAYPAPLKQIAHPPKMLYARGRVVSNEICVAVVGTRACSDDGKSAAITITQGLVEAGITIVSGLMTGIDTVAHQIAVETRPHHRCLGYRH